MDSASPMGRRVRARPWPVPTMRALRHEPHVRRQVRAETSSWTRSTPLPSVSSSTRACGVLRTNPSPPRRRGRARAPRRPPLAVASAGAERLRQLHGGRAEAADVPCSRTVSPLVERAPQSRRRRTPTGNIMPMAAASTNEPVLHAHDLVSTISVLRVAALVPPAAAAEATRRPAGGGPHAGPLRTTAGPSARSLAPARRRVTSSRPRRPPVHGRVGDLDQLRRTWLRRRVVVVHQYLGPVPSMRTAFTAVSFRLRSTSVYRTIAGSRRRRHRRGEAQAGGRVAGDSGPQGGCTACRRLRPHSTHDDPDDDGDGAEDDDEGHQAVITSAVTRARGRAGRSSSGSAAEGVAGVDLGQVSRSAR